MPRRSLKVVPERNPLSIRLAADELRGGGFVVAPTDTIYGILADATNYEAVRRLYLTRRPSGRPFIVLVPDLFWVRKLGLCTDVCSEKLLMKPFVTVVLRKCSPRYHWLGRDSVAVRVPRRGFVRGLLEILGRPVVAPSANPEGEPPARNVEEAINYFGDEVSLYVDGGTFSGPPSALVDLRGEPRVLRRGPYTERSLEALIRSLPPYRG